MPERQVIILRAAKKAASIALHGHGRNIAAKEKSHEK
jgi:hypothetical protein